MVTIALIILILLATSASSVAAAPVGTKESDVVKYAKSWVGVRNVHGGNSRAGIDCSHLVYQVYSKARAKGISFMTVPAMKKSAGIISEYLPQGPETSYSGKKTSLKMAGDTTLLHMWASG